MKKIRIGDCFELNTSKEKLHFQFVYGNKSIGELIRVLPKKFSQDLDGTDNHKEDFLLFPLREAYRKGMVRLAGNFQVPKSLILPHKMRTRKFSNNKGVIALQAVDYDTWHKNNKRVISDEEKDFLLREQGKL